MDDLNKAVQGVKKGDYLQLLVYNATAGADAGGEYSDQ